MFNLLFLPSMDNSKSAIDTLISFAVFLSRDLKFRLTAQASFHLVECVMTLQRNNLMFFSVEKRGEILKRGEKIHRLPSLLPCRESPAGLLTARHPFEKLLSPLLSVNQQF